MTTKTRLNLNRRKTSSLTYGIRSGCCLLAALIAYIATITLTNDLNGPYGVSSLTSQTVEVEIGRLGGIAWVLALCLASIVFAARGLVRLTKEK